MIPNLVKVASVLVICSFRLITVTARTMLPSGAIIKKVAAVNIVDSMSAPKNTNSRKNDIPGIIRESSAEIEY